MLVRIIAGHAVLLYPDGVTPTLYDDQVIYDVRPHVAESMIVRGWAEVVNPSSLAAEAPPRTKRRTADG